MRLRQTGSRVVVHYVRELMSPAQRCVDRSDPVTVVAQRMRESGVSSIPVCSARGIFLGMVSDRDIVEQCVADARDPRGVAAGALLIGIGREPEVVSADRCVDSALLGLVLRQPLAELPVVENGRLIGMITAADLAMPLISDDRVEDAMGSLWPSQDF